MVEVNITLVGTKIVQDTKFLAFEKNNNVDVINITVDTNGEWTYKLDVRYPDKCCTGEAQYNIINLVKTDNIYTAVLTSDMLPFSGKYTMQIRAINGDKIQHSDTFDAWVKYSIEPGETYNPVPSEFYQIEANVTEINNHPPYPSDDGYWMIYNVNTHEYEKSEIPVIAKPGDGLPDIDITTDGKYLSNDGTKAIWADVEVEAKDAVLYTRQDLTDAQKQQARDNIGAGTSSFSGSYNDLTNKPDAYELPIASSSQLGGVKPDNKIDDMTQVVGVDNEGKLWSEPDIFIVNIRNAVSDKSSAEIFLAISNGKIVYANDGGRIYPSIGGQGTILQQFAIVTNAGNISGYSIRGTAVTQLQNWVEVTSNKVNTISATSSDNQYPSAKCVWDALQEVGGGGETWETIAEIPLEQDTISYILTSISGWRKIKLLIRKVYNNTGSGYCWLGIYTGNEINLRVMVDSSAIKAQNADIFVDVADYFCMELRYGNNILTAGTVYRTAQLDIGSGTTEESVLRLDVDASYAAAFDGTGTITVMGVHA